MSKARAATVAGPFVRLRRDVKHRIGWPEIRRLPFAATLVMFISFGGQNARAYEISDYTWHAYNGHLYAATFVVGPWDAAQAEAAALGANLVTINDAEENAWLTEQFDNISTTTADSDKVVWIGYRQVGGVWGWVSGEAVTYENICGLCFRKPGPHMYLHTASHPNAGTWNYNSWHDTMPSHFLHGVIERDVAAIPTVSEWGMVVLALLLLTAGTLMLMRRRRHRRCGVTPCG